MDLIQSVSLWLHILSGYFALTIGTLIMFMKKGDRRHGQFGRYFFYCMVLVSFTAIFMSYQKNNGFLFHVGIFSFFLSYGGWRSVRDRSLRPNIADLIILLVAFLNALMMVRTGHLILMVFGGITIYLFILDLRWYWLLFVRKEKAGNRWLARHIGMMGGAYISAFTAFLTVNLHFDGPAWIIWLSPTIVMVPLMQYWTWRYTGRRALTKY